MTIKNRWHVINGVGIVVVSIVFSTFVVFFQDWGSLILRLMAGMALLSYAGWTANWAYFAPRFVIHGDRLEIVAGMKSQSRVLRRDQVAGADGQEVLVIHTTDGESIRVTAVTALLAGLLGTRRSRETFVDRTARLVRTWVADGEGENDNRADAGA